MSKNVKFEPQIRKIWANLDFLEQIHGLVQKKSTQNFFWTKTKNTCTIILIETPNNEI
jgi:hypothetical protein